MAQYYAYVQYKHHDNPVWVRADLQGKHKEHCLCYSCVHFFPGHPNENCEIAEALYRFDILTATTTPVWECPLFGPEEEGGP